MVEQIGNNTTEVIEHLPPQDMAGNIIMPSPLWDGCLRLFAFYLLATVIAFPFFCFVLVSRHIGLSPYDQLCLFMTVFAWPVYWIPAIINSPLRGSGLFLILQLPVIWGLWGSKWYRNAAILIALSLQAFLFMITTS